MPKGLWLFTYCLITHMTAIRVMLFCYNFHAVTTVFNPLTRKRQITDGFNALK